MPVVSDQWGKVFAESKCGQVFLRREIKMDDLAESDLLVKSQQAWRDKVTAIYSSKSRSIGRQHRPEEIANAKLTASVFGAAETEVFNHCCRKYRAGESSAGSDRAL